MMEQEPDQGLAEVGKDERYYTATRSDRPYKRLVRILADMVEAAMNRTQGNATDKK